MREVQTIHRPLSQGGDADDAPLCLTLWLKLCGPATMDDAVFDVLGAEMDVAARAKQDVAGWHATLVRLFTDCTDTGMPLPTGDTRARDVERLTRNAEVSLLAALSAVTAADPAELPRVKPPKSRLAATLHRLLGPVSELSVARRSLNAPDLVGADLWSTDLTRADLTRTDLTQANLTRADMKGTEFLHANLVNANLWYADLRMTDLRDADMGGANLTDANLRYAKLREANLCGANLRDADLRGASLTGGNLTGANLKDAIAHIP